MPHCNLRVRWKVASDLRFRAAMSQPKTPSFCRISGDLAPSTRKSLAIAIVRFWCTKNMWNSQPARGGGGASLNLPIFGREEKAPTPTLSALLRKWRVLRRADFALTKDPRPLYNKTPPCLFQHKLALREMACWVVSKDEICPS